MPRPNSSGPSLSSDVPFAAIAGAREIRGKITRGPGLRVAAGSNVVEPGARQYLLAAAGPAVRDQLADQRQIADRGADAAGGAGGAQAIDRDVGASRRSHLAPDQLADQISVAAAGRPLD